MTEDSQTRDVREWLERGGYVLEMRVARVLTARGLTVEQGYHYKDPTTGAEREGDLAAFVDVGIDGEDRLHSFDLMIECKRTTSPWVGFVGTGGINGATSLGSSLNPRCAICARMLTGTQRIRRGTPLAYAITEKRSPGSKTKDNAYEGTQQVVNASLQRHFGKAFGGHEAPRIIPMLAIPVVVTESPLFACALDASGQIVLDQVDRMTVLVPRLVTPDPDSDGVEVLVVAYGALDRFLDEVLALCDPEGNDPLSHSERVSRPEPGSG